MARIGLEEAQVAAALLGEGALGSPLCRVLTGARFFIKRLVGLTSGQVIIGRRSSSQNRI